MSSQDSGQSEDRELLDRYRRASDTEPSAPSDAVRAAILAEGRRVAAQLKDQPNSQRLFDASRPAANDSRWKFTAFGTLGAALLAALIIAPRYWGTLPASKTSSSAASAPAPTPASVPQAAIPAPKLESASPSPSRDSLREIAVTAARRKHQDAPALPAAVPLPPPALASESAPLAYSPPPEERAQAGVSARSADNAVSSRINPMSDRIVGGWTSLSDPARLIAAAEADDVAQTIALIDKGTNVNARDMQGRTALMIAVSRGRLEVVRLLLQRGADPNLTDNSHRTALQVALDQNLNDIAAALRDAGAR